MQVRALEKYIPLRTHVESFYKHRDVKKRQSLAWQTSYQNKLT